MIMEKQTITNQERLEVFRDSLLLWYDRNKRSFPWRDRQNAYYTWISEIMLQQTRAQAVIPYFEHFIEKLPDISALAKCSDDELLKLWEGLGYYNRARNLKKTAVLVEDKYQGELPRSFEELLKLPGIGRYTAGAVASIAYEEPVPAVDGNVMRVIARIIMSREDILKDAAKIRVEELLKKVMPHERPGDLNQAMMDLGAMICVPKKPACPACPVRQVCLAKKAGAWDEIPVRSSPKERKMEYRTVFIIQDGERTALRKRQNKGLLAGMYELPNEKGSFSEDEALAYVKKSGMIPLYIEKAPEAKHVFSHIEWHMKAYRIRTAALTEEVPEFLFVDFLNEEDRYAIPSAFDVYKKYLKG